MSDYWTADIGGVQVTARLARDEGRIVDIHATCGPPGSSLGLILESVCRAGSICLRAGVPLDRVLRQWRGQRFEPAGETGDADVPTCTSVIDYIAQAVSQRA